MKREKEIEVIGESNGVKITRGIGDRVYVERRMDNPDGSLSWIPWIKFVPQGQYHMQITTLTLETKQR